MNSATRLAVLLSQIQNKNGTALFIWKEVFGVDSCAKVTMKLLLCQKQIEILEENLKDKGDVFKSTIGRIKPMFSCDCLSSNISNKNLMTQSIENLHIMGSLMSDDTEYSEDITNLLDQILILREEVRQSEVNEIDRYVFNTFLDEIEEGVANYDIAGALGFERHIEVAGAKIVLNKDLFLKTDIGIKLKDLYIKVTKIAKEIKFWGGLLEFIKS